jgi:hypothetical protein
LKLRIERAFYRVVPRAEIVSLDAREISCSGHGGCGGRNIACRKVAIFYLGGAATYIVADGFVTRVPPLGILFELTRISI